MATGFMGVVISGCALDSSLWAGALVLVIGNLVMMAAGQRLLDRSMDDGFIDQNDIEEIEESIDKYDAIEHEFIMRNRRDNTFSIWVQETKGGYY